MQAKFGVDSFIWSENFTERDLWIIPKARELGFDAIDLFIAISHPDTFPTAQVKKEKEKTGIEVVTTTTLNQDTNFLSPDKGIRKKGVEVMKQIVNINYELGSNIFGGVNYAGWGCLSGKPRTEDEWKRSVESMREVANYAKGKGDITLAVEPVNRFETHFLNIAEDAVRYCREVGTGNLKVHLDTFHMIREELSFAEAVKACGQEYLGYVHVCENNRGIPGTGLVPWKEFFSAVRKIGYDGPLVIESFDPGFVELNRLCAIWRKFAETGEELAVKGLKNLKEIEKEMEADFGSNEKPLLVSVRSGAKISMPGMMDTILNLGLNNETLKALIKQTGNERFALDSYRRLIQMFGNVVMGIEKNNFENILHAKKEELGIKLDTELDPSALRDIISKFKNSIKACYRKDTLDCSGDSTKNKPSPTIS